MSRLKTPKEWPRPNRAFSNSGSLKTSELLLLAGTYSTNLLLKHTVLLFSYVGPVGAYMFSFLDIDVWIKLDMIKVMRMMEMMMRKTSTEGDRSIIRRYEILLNLV